MHIRSFVPTVCAALLLSVSLVGSAFAGDGDKKDEKKEEKKDEKAFPVVKPGALVFAHYGLDLTDGANMYNAFDLDRAYLILKADLSPSLSARLTLDADRQKPVTIAVPDGAGGTTDITVAADTKTRVFIKHAYLEWKVKSSGVKLRFGMADTAWAPMVDGFTGTRYIAKSVGDSAKFVSPADLGVQAMGEHAKGLIGWQVGLINGEGYASPEIDASKTVQARITVDPIASGNKMNLPISGYFSQSIGGDGDAIMVYGGGLGFKMPYVLFWGEYLGKSVGDVGSSAMSFTVVPRVPKVINVIARLDIVDPDGSADKDETTTIIAGVSHDFMEKVSGAVTFERASIGEANTQGIFFRMQAGF